jgi:ribonuclease BN (tRNA processing enzyme)
MDTRQSTRVVLLGTGTPWPDPSRSGPATAIIVNDTPYLIDFGPGVVRRASAAYESGVTEIGFAGVNIKTVFLTHMHSDHTVGYPDLIFTPWVMDRREPLEVYGPKGIKAMTEHVLKAWQIDIDGRTNGINQRNATGYKVNAHEIAPGVVYRDNDVTVTAFPDVLIHEAYSEASHRAVSPRSQAFRRCHHTSAIELAAIANEVKPGLLIIYHRSNAGGRSLEPEDVLLDEIRQGYGGRVVMGHDLDIF